MQYIANFFARWLGHSFSWYDFDCPVCNALKAPTTIIVPFYEYDLFSKNFPDETFACLKCKASFSIVTDVIAIRDEDSDVLVQLLEARSCHN